MLTVEHCVWCGGDDDGVAAGVGPSSPEGPRYLNSGTFMGRGWEVSGG